MLSHPAAGDALEERRRRGGGGGRSGRIPSPPMVVNSRWCQRRWSKNFCGCCCLLQRKCPVSPKTVEGEERGVPGGGGGMTSGFGLHNMILTSCEIHTPGAMSNGY